MSPTGSTCGFLEFAAAAEIERIERKAFEGEDTI
jgi:hypothetical protein